jgi:hypothetical protein
MRHIEGPYQTDVDYDQGKHSNHKRGVMLTRGEPGRTIIMLAVTVATTIKAVAEAPGVMTTAADVGTKDLRCISLDVPQTRRDHVIWSPKTLHATHTWKNVTDTRLPIFVNPLGQTHEAEMRGKIATVILRHGVHVCLDVCLKNGDNINVLHMLDCPKKSTAPLTIIVEKSELGLKPEVQKKSMAEIKNIQKIFQYWSQNLESRVKPRNRQRQNFP